MKESDYVQQLVYMKEHLWEIPKDTPESYRLAVQALELVDVEHVASRAYRDGIYHAADFMHTLLCSDVKQDIEFPLVVVPASLMYCIGFQARVSSEHEITGDFVPYETMGNISTKGPVPDEMKKLVKVMNQDRPEHLDLIVRENPRASGNFHMATRMLEMNDFGIRHYYFYTMPMGMMFMDFLSKCYLLGWKRADSESLS